MLRNLGVGGAIAILVILILAAGFLLSSAVIWLVWNALAAYFGFKAITFGIAAAICLGLSIISEFIRSNNSK